MVLGALAGLGGRLTLRPHSAADPDDGRPMHNAIKALLHVAPSTQPVTSGEEEEFTCIWREFSCDLLLHLAGIQL